MGAVLVGGFFDGLIFGLLALGLVLTYRVSRIINFGYGETGMLACFVYLEIRLGDPRPIFGFHFHDHGLWPALPVGLLLGAVIGALMEVCIARPARRGSTLNGMVASLAVGTSFLFFAAHRYGATNHVSVPVVAGRGITVFGLRVSPEQVLIFVCTAVIVPSLLALYRFTSLGLRLRACAVDPYAASLCGISVNATSTITWAMAGMLSALSAILIAGLSPSIGVLFMTLLAVRSFIAALVGGLTSLVGAILAGIALGMAQHVIEFKVHTPGTTELILVAGIMALTVLRPGGLVRADY